MRFLISVISTDTNDGTSDELAAIDAFNDRLRADGHWVLAGGLASPASATTIDDRDGAGIVLDGPFVETKEFLAGFWVLEAADADVALRLATEASRACHRKVELRAFL